MLDPRRVAFLARLALVLLVAATLFGFAGAMWWAFDLFSHFRVQYVVAALLLALVLSVLCRDRWVLLAVALGAANLLPVVPLFLHPPEAVPEKSGHRLRLMSFNVFGFNRQDARMLEYVRRERPDVLVLLEITPEWLPSIRQLAADYPHRWINAGNAVTGIAVLSRAAPQHSNTLDLARNGVPSYLLTFESDGGSISVLGTHLSWPFGEHNAKVRNSQLAALAQLARDHTGPLVIVGDLNITSFSPVFQQALREGGLRRCVPDAGLTPTWPARVPPLFIQIDHCLATAGVQAWGFEVGEYLGSDHYPITVEVAPTVVSKVGS